MRLLIVDDSKAMRMIVRRVIRRAGLKFDVAEATNGEDALRHMRQQGVPEVVLCDWNMPEMSGIELLGALATHGFAPNVFGFITSERTPAMREAAREAGAAFLLPKPVSPEQLRDVLEQALS